MMRGQLLAAAKSMGLFKLARAATAPAVRILCYHGLWLGEGTFSGDQLFMSPATFSRRMDTIKRLGYPVISLDDAIQGIRGRRALPANAVVITFDDGWYSSHWGMGPKLKELGFPATLYCDTQQMSRSGPVPHVMAEYLAKACNIDATAAPVAPAFKAATNLDRSHEDRLASVHEFATAAGIDIAPYLQRRVFDYMTPDELRDLRAGGVDVQLHTHRHELGDFSRAKIATEIDDNRRALSDILNIDPKTLRHFCYPSGEWVAAASPIMDELDIESATTSDRGLAWPRAQRHSLARLSDGGEISDLKFEADLCGFTDLAKAAVSRTQRLTALNGDLALARVPR